MSLFEARAFKEITKVNEVTRVIEVSPYKKRKIQQGCMCTEESLCGDTDRGWLDASRGESPQEKPALLIS